MRTEFHYKGPRSEVGFTYSGRDLVFLSIFIASAVLIVVMVVATASETLNGPGLVEDLLEFVTSWRALK